MRVSGEKQYFPLSSIPQQIINVPFDQTVTTVSNLVPDTNYLVAIVTVYRFGDGEVIKQYVQTLEGG